MEHTFKRFRGAEKENKQKMGCVEVMKWQERH